MLLSSYYGLDRNVFLVLNVCNVPDATKNAHSMFAANEMSFYACTWGVLTGLACREWRVVACAHVPINCLR